MLETIHSIQSHTWGPRVILKMQVCQGMVIVAAELQCMETELRSEIVDSFEK
jgi:hypothetical protein